MDKAVIEKSCLKQNWVMNIKNQYFDYVFLGSSRAENMIDAKMIAEHTGKKVINISISGCGHEELYLVLSQFIKNGNKAKNLFYQNDIYGFQNKAGVNYPFHDYAYLPYLEDALISEVFKDVVGSLKFYFWKYIPYFKYAEFNIWYPIKYLWEKEPCEYRLYDEYGSALLSKDNLGALEVERLFVDTLNQKTYDFDPQAIRYVKKNMQLTLDKKINLTIYTAPEYYKLFETQINRAEMNIKIDSLSRSYNADFLLFENDTICRNKKLFVDYSHLNIEGTKLFTQKLIEYINEKGI
jgi:hypothetical protein